jgi:AmmeMemoRadiSam system protein A
MLSEQKGRVLLRLARQTIASRLEIDVPTPLTAKELQEPELTQQQGVFVTLNKRGQLRGCIGSLNANESIVDGVRRHAGNAAFHDHRFQPLRAEEFPDLEISVSVLTTPEALEYTDGNDLTEKLRPDIDGVIIRSQGGAGATFLPQVWQQLPRPEQFLGNLCRKAGLADDFWRTGQLTVQTYQVQYFRE